MCYVMCEELVLVVNVAALAMDPHASGVELGCGAVSAP